MDRIRQNQLEWLVNQINTKTKSPIAAYTKAKGKFTANIGNYHLDYAYSGVKLVRMCNEGGGITDISRTGYGTKRELYNWMQAFLAGMSA